MSVLQRVFKVDTAWGVALLVLVMSLSLAVGFQFRDSVYSGSPIVLREDTHMIGQSVVGGMLRLSIHRDLKGPSAPVCDGSTDRLLWRWKRRPDGIWEREIAPFAFRGKANPYGDPYFQLDLRIPLDLDPGPYNFTVFYYQPCDLMIRMGLRQQQIYPQGPIRVLVDPATAPSPLTILAAVSAAQSVRHGFSLSETMPQPLRMDAADPDPADGLTFSARAAQELIKELKK